MLFFKRQKRGIVNVKMIITEEKILSNIDKVQKLINPNSKKQIIQLDEDAFFKDLIDSIKLYLIEYPNKKNFPGSVYKSAHGLVEYATNQFEENTKQIEELMIRNQQSSIPNYQEQLAQLTSQRDSIGSNIETLSSSKKTYEWVIQNERETDHKNRIAQVERLLGIHITSNAGFVYDNELKVPRSVSKDTATLRREQGAINKQLEQLYYDGELDLKTYNSMKMEVLREYDSMVAKAPKPTQTPARDDSTFTQQQEQNPTPVQHPYINPNVREKVEQREFHSQEPQSGEKKKLEEQRRELRRKQFEERARAMGLDLNQIANLDNLFIQQEMIEQQSIEETEELEEHRGMMM